MVRWTPPLLNQPFLSTSMRSQVPGWSRSYVWLSDCRVYPSSKLNLDTFTFMCIFMNSWVTINTMHQGRDQSLCYWYSVSVSLKHSYFPQGPWIFLEVSPNLPFPLSRKSPWCVPTFPYDLTCTPTCKPPNSLSVPSAIVPWLLDCLHLRAYILSATISVNLLPAVWFLPTSDPCWIFFACLYWLKIAE